MRTLINSIVVVDDKRATNPIDVLIFEQGVRIADAHINKKLDLLILILSNGNVIKSSLTSFHNLKRASQKNLDNWKLISKGIGIEWVDIDEQLSLKGFLDSFIKNSLINPANFNYAVEV